MWTFGRAFVGLLLVTNLLPALSSRSSLRRAERRRDLDEYAQKLLQWEQNITARLLDVRQREVDVQLSVEDPCAPSESREGNRRAI